MAEITIPSEEYHALLYEAAKYKELYKEVTKDVDALLIKSDVVVEYSPQLLRDFVFIKLPTDALVGKRLLGALKFRADQIKKLGHRLY